MRLAARLRLRAGEYGMQYVCVSHLYLKIKEIQSEAFIELSVFA
jgi:hypothetical protein